MIKKLIGRIFGGGKAAAPAPVEDAVPRMPMVFQVGSMRTWGEFIGMPKCRTIGASPFSSSTALVINRLPTGEAEANTLRAVIL